MSGKRLEVELKDQTPTDFLLSKIGSLKINQITHYHACERHLRQHRTAGILLVVFSTVSLGLAFADTSSLPYSEFFGPVLSIAVALLSAVLTFMGNQALASEHQSSAVAYGALLRECEARLTEVYSEEENRSYVPNFLARWEEISQTSPLTKLKDRQLIEKAIVSDPQP